MVKGMVWLSSRQYEDLKSLKANLRRKHTLQEVNFKHIVATGGAGATIEIEEKTGVTITRPAAEAQAYIRAHTDNAAYEDATIAVSWLDDAGVIHDAVSSTLDDNAVTEVIITGAADFYRPRPDGMLASVVPEVGHSFSIGDDNHANDGSGNDLWAMIEEGYYQSVHSRYFVPTATSGGKLVTSYLAQMKAKYRKAADMGEPLEYCNLNVVCTPKDLDIEITLEYTIFAGESFTWECPFQLKGATDVTFQVIDDAATGGNFDFEYIIVEATEET